MWFLFGQDIAGDGKENKAKWRRSKNSGISILLALTQVAHVIYGDAYVCWHCTSSCCFLINYI